MHTPTGIKIDRVGDSAFQVTITNLHDFIFTPTFIFRSLHIYIAAIIEGLLLQCLLIIFLMKQASLQVIPIKAVKASLISCLLFLFLQPLIGHIQFSLITKYQPIKAAAVEGYYKSNEAFHYYLIGTTEPDKSQSSGIHLPFAMEKRISSTFEKVRGLNDVDKSDWPEVKAVFYFFHVMLLCWVGIVVLVVSLLITLRKMPQSLNRVFNYLKTAILLLLIAALAGWATSEMGRQPWLIYNLIKTSHANTYTCDTFDTMLSIISSFVLPLVLLILWVMLQKAELKYFLSHKN